MSHLHATHCRLLYVDDDPIHCAMFRRLFDLSGLTVTVAHTVAEAKAAARNDRFDVVVLDLHLGSELGTNLAARLHASQPKAYKVPRIWRWSRPGSKPPRARRSSSTRTKSRLA